MRIGFVGLGVMGAPMAANLLRAGYELSVHRVKDSSRHLLDAGATAPGSAGAVARECEVVVLMLPDTPDVEEVLLGEDGVLAELRPGSLVIDMSSISPVATRHLAHQVDQAGSQYVDAPVSGGQVGAEQGTLTVLVGGSAEAVRRAWPLLEVLGSRVTHLGGPGAGQTAKVANQIVVGLTIQAVAEGLAFAQAGGVDLASLRDALTGGFATSRVLELHGQRMVEGGFDPGFRMRLHHKDLGLALEAAESLGLRLPVTAATRSMMAEAIEHGLAEADHSALFRLVSTGDPNGVQGG